MDEKTADVCRMVAEVICNAGLTDFEVGMVFSKVRGNLTVGGYKPFISIDEKTPEG